MSYYRDCRQFLSLFAMMRFLFSFFILLCCSYIAMTGNEVVRHWSVSGSSSFQIKGSTNINNFVCASGDFVGEDMLIGKRRPGTDQWELNGEILLKVDGFDCSNRMMNHDFQETLESETYPEIKIQFHELKEVAGQSPNAIGLVEISMTGVTRTYPVYCELISSDEGYSILKGKKVLYFSDFGLEPPRKGLGMVRVKDELVVDFQLRLEQILP